VTVAYVVDEQCEHRWVIRGRRGGDGQIGLPPGGV
jgi:hypothetical protein